VLHARLKEVTMNASRIRAALLREVYREIIITLATVFAVSKRLPDEHGLDCPSGWLSM
jgi:hypothetical protein